MGLFHQAKGFPLKPQGLALPMHRRHPLEERRVQHDGVPVRRQLGRQFGAKGANIVVRMGAGEGVEHPGHPIENRSGLLQGHNGVLEGGRLAAG